MEGLGTEQNKKIYTRHGAPERMYGLSMAHLNKLKREIGKNHPLALQLWSTGIMDARCLATFIADPVEMGRKELAHWISQSNYYVLVDMVAQLIFKTNHAQVIMEDYIRSEDEWESRVAWKLLAFFAIEHKTLPDAYFIPYVEFIKDRIHQQKNRTREAMNLALIAMGIRNDNLEKICIEAAKTIGKVRVNHGQTSCKTPDAEKYILKSKKRMKSRQPQ